MLFPANPEEKIQEELSGQSRAPALTVVSKFKASLEQLLQVLHSTTPHYIRCIKPNSQSQPQTFLQEEVTNPELRLPSTKNKEESISRWGGHWQSLELGLTLRRAFLCSGRAVMSGCMFCTLHQSLTKVAHGDTRASCSLLI